MKYQIFCDSDVCSIGEENGTFIEANNSEDLRENVCCLLKENVWIENYVQETIGEIIEIMPIRGYYDDLEQLSEEMYAQTKRRLMEKDGIIKVVCQNAEDFQDTRILAISLAEISGDMVDERAGYDQRYCDLCGLIEMKLDQFSEKGCWNIGLLDSNQDLITDILKWPEPEYGENHIGWKDGKEVYYPIVWFGLKDQLPEPLWTLGGPFFDEDTLQFWKSDDDSASTSIVPDLDDPYGMGYWFWECGCSTMNVEIIRAQCPIRLEEDDTVQSVLKKIGRLFWARWNSAYHNQGK